MIEIIEIKLKFNRINLNRRKFDLNLTIINIK